MPPTEDPLIAKAFDAMLRADISTLRQLLDDGLPPDATGLGGTSLLKYAAGEQSLEFIVLLLSRGANVNRADARGFTPLHVAAGHWNPEITMLLLDAGADIYAKSSAGRLPVLHEAADAATVLLLCGRGIDPNTRDVAGNTPLHWARWDDRPDVAAALQSHGANSSLKNDRGLTADDVPPDDWQDYAL